MKPKSNWIEEISVYFAMAAAVMCYVFCIFLYIGIDYKYCPYLKALIIVLAAVDAAMLGMLIGSHIVVCWSRKESK